jgi:hypothetical protein
VQIDGVEDMLQLTEDDFCENAELPHAAKRRLVRKESCGKIICSLLRFGEIAEQLANG